MLLDLILQISSKLLSRWDGTFLRSGLRTLDSSHEILGWSAYVGDDRSYFHSLLELVCFDQMVKFGEVSVSKNKALLNMRRYRFGIADLLPHGVDFLFGRFG